MAEKDPRLSHQTLRVLRLLSEHPRDTLAGSDILKTTGMLSGTLYPILMRLERAGWLESRWEELNPSDVGRPRKRFYSLTPNGLNKTNEALAQLGLRDGRPAWSF
jgi:DNA-binding PadR family transcriptional regulator